MLTVIADDLTGAAEVAGVCLRYGLEVAFGINRLPDGDVDVKVIATDSRQSGREEALKIHRELAVSLKEAGITNIFKKVDSVLRGYVVEELYEVMKVYGFQTAVVQPANPASGRCIKKGNYKISGKPINETAFAGDPDFPAFSQSVKDLLEERTANKEISIQTLFLRTLAKGIIVPDCQSGADMKRLLSIPVLDTVYAGSAAFLGAYLRVKSGHKMTRKNLNFNPFEGRFLMVCGSTHYQSRDFINKAASKGIEVSLIPYELMQPEIDEKMLEEIAVKQSNLWNEHGRLIIAFSEEPVSYEDCTTVLKKRMSTIVGIILKRSPVVELLIEGGATAFSILTQLGWTSLNPVKELAPGVVRMQVRNNPGFYIIMKPGSYQWPEYLNF